MKYIIKQIQTEVITKVIIHEASAEDEARAIAKVDADPIANRVGITTLGESTISLEAPEALYELE